LQLLLKMNLEAVYSPGEGSDVRGQCGGQTLREGAWIGAIYAQIVGDLHRNKLVEAGKSRGILICNGREIFQRREWNRSQPGESATKLDSGNRRRQADGKLTQHERPEGEGKCGLRLLTLSKMG